MPEPASPAVAPPPASAFWRRPILLLARASWPSSWSVRGQRFDLQIVRVDGTQRKTLAESADGELDAAWSPDGTRVSFSRWEQTAEGNDWQRSQIWVVGVDGANAIRLGRGHQARWSPDGTLLVFPAPTADSDSDLSS